MSEGVKSPGDLLGPDALKGLRIAISASESPDLGRLGLVETHFRLALGEIARSVLISGGKLCYGGHLEPEGYTAALIQELHRYSRRDRPLQICLAWQEHRKISKADFERQKNELGLFGEIVCLNPEGQAVAWEANRKSAAPEPVTDVELCQQSLTGLRRFMATQCNGRVLIGGKRVGFQGRFPGVLEEALISVEANQPLYLAGGFGGVAADIARILGLDDGAWLPANTDELPIDGRLALALDQLSKLVKSKDPKALSNGLSTDENRRLAATHRPSEIAALVSLGLGGALPQVQHEGELHELACA
jgi:SLOG cluster2